MPYCRNCGGQLLEGAEFCQNCGTPIRGPARSRLATAGWGERFVAWLIDIIIVGIFILPVRSFWAWIGFPLLRWGPPFLRWFPSAIFGLDNVIFYFLYWMLMEGIYGQSIGKMALRLRVVRLDRKPVDIGIAAIESIGKAFLLPIDCIIGWILYPDKNQRLFNYISGTVTVKTSS